MRKIIPCSTGECTDSYYAGQNTTTISFQIPMEVLPTGGKRELRHHWADDVPKTAPTYLLKLLNEGAENQHIASGTTLEELCLRCGMTYLEAEAYLWEDWASDRDIDELLNRYFG